MSKGLGGNLQLSLTDKDIVGDEFDPLDYSYAKVSPLASNIKKQIPSNNGNFGVRTVFQVSPVYGQFINGMYLQITLPALTLTSGTYAAWTDTLGFAILEKLELELNGIIVDTHIGPYYDVLHELEETRKNTNLMILQSDIYTAVPFNALEPVTMYIPFQFWFNRKVNQSLPLLIYKEWQINVYATFKSFDECVVYDGTTPPLPVSFSQCNLWVDYIVVPTSCIEQKLLDQEYRQICQLLQYTRQEIESNTKHIQIPLPFQFSVKELLFVFVENESLENNDYFNYSQRTTGDAFLVAANLYLDGRERYVEDQSEHLLRQVNPYKYHTQCSNKRIYSMPFGTDEGNQPTGLIDFTRVDNATLYLSLTDNIPACTLTVMAITMRPLISFLTLNTPTLKERMTKLPQLLA